RNSYKNFDWIALIRNRFFNLWVRLCKILGGGAGGGKNSGDFSLSENCNFPSKKLDFCYVGTPTENSPLLPEKDTDKTKDIVN
ncbi:hypothetical protein JWG44_15570, partial [Leptospira sp. 201903071]|nr:hypothetical protein [Leptospira ainazelensis]